MNILSAWPTRASTEFATCRGKRRSINDQAKWNLALSNALNVQQDLCKEKVEVVAYGPGLGMLKSDSKITPRLAQALDSSVGLAACENTVRNTSTNKADMLQRHWLRRCRRRAHHEAPERGLGLHQALIFAG